MYGRSLILRGTLLALILFASACSDPSDTTCGATEAEIAQGQSTEIFPRSHNPQRMAKIGPKACVDCHAEEVAEWEQSHHAKANRPISVELDAVAFAGEHTLEKFGVVYKMMQIDDAFRLQVIEQNGSVTNYDLVGVIGETPIRQYLAQLPGNRLQAISATYDVINDRWIDVFAGENRMPGEWGHWTGQGMNWNANCASCHTTEFEKGFDLDGNVYHSKWMQQGLACVECHTGLEEHVVASHAGDVTSGIPQLDREQVKQNCATCHSRRDQLTADAFEPGNAYHDHFSLALPDQPGLYYPDGQILDEVFVHASFEMSRMNHAGVTCVDCHNPHSLEYVLPVENNMLCMRCHQTGTMKAPIIEPVKHSFHPEGSTGNQCIECHMSETVYMQTDWRADHGFSAPDPLITKELGIPNACNKCHTGKSVDWAIEHSERWYGEALAESRQRLRARAISKAYNFDPAGLPELLTLSKDEDISAWQATYAGLIANYLPNTDAEAHLRRLLEHESELVRARATSGLAMAENGSQALIEKLKDISRSVRIAASRGLASRNETISDKRASDEWKRYLEFNSDRPQSLFIMANQASLEGRSQDVIRFVEQAISLDTANPEIYHQGAILLSSAGLNKEARSQLFKGWERAPKEARFPYCLGLLAAESGDLKTAIDYLEEAIAIEPQFYRAWYNLSLAYLQLNRPEDAHRAMQKAQGR